MLPELSPSFSHPQLMMQVCRNTNAWEAGVSSGDGEDFWGDRHTSTTAAGAQSSTSSFLV